MFGLRGKESVSRGGGLKGREERNCGLCFTKGTQHLSRMANAPALPEKKIFFLSLVYI